MKKVLVFCVLLFLFFGCIEIERIKPRCAKAGGYLCKANETCFGQVLDTNESNCCDMQCIAANCDDLNGFACSASQKCPGYLIPATNTNFCCSEECIARE